MEGSVYDIHHKTNLNLLLYIGSTNDFNIRKSQHKHNCYNHECKEHNYQVYKYIRDNGGWENWEMTEIYFGSEYLEKEKEILKEHFDECINSYETGRSKAEYHAEWYQENKERLTEKIKCERCGSIVSRLNILRHQKTEKCKNHSSPSSSVSESE